MSPLPLVLTPGDPLGIGPEVTAKALAERAVLPSVCVAGDAPVFEREAHRLGLQTRRTTTVQSFIDAVAVLDTRDGDEPTEVAAIRLGVGSQLGGQSRGLVTGPIHKNRLAAQGFAYPGHTDFLGHLCGARPVMAFAGGQLKVSLVTVHLPLRQVADAVTFEGVLHTVQVSHRALVSQLGIARPRLAVCGLNPHAGDGGLLGREEIEVIAPAVARAVAEGIDARGPLSAEAAFRQAADGQVDLVVAMYHDQGLAPLKLVDFGQSVNWTLGLPIVRTSVDHGTADDIAGQGIADASSMQAALRFAESLTR